MTAWEGDLSFFGELEDNLNQLAGVPSRAARDASRDIAKAIDQQFAHGLDPYGEPWAPLAESTLAKGRTPPPMTNSGAMRAGIHVRPMGGAGIEVSCDAEYLGFHQGAGSPRANVPPRHVLPEGELPDTYQRAIADALDAAVERAMA